MAKSPAKPSVSKSKPIKYSLSYVRVSTKDQLDGSGIKRQENAYQEWLRRNKDYENLDEFKDHKEIVNSALITAQDLHGRLVASLRNNENEVAMTLISAIELNKESEIAFLNNTLKLFSENYENILENIGQLP